MLVETRSVTLEELDGMQALELPPREMLGLVTITITNVLNNLSVDVTVKNNNVAVQVCAVVDVLNSTIGSSLVRPTRVSSAGTWSTR